MVRSTLLPPDLVVDLNGWTLGDSTRARSSWPTTVAVGPRLPSHAISYRSAFQRSAALALFPVALTRAQRQGSGAADVSRSPRLFDVQRRERRHVIQSGAQIRSARAFLGWRRTDLAAVSPLHAQACAYWERAGVIPPPLRSGRLQGEPWAVRKIRVACESAGLRFITQPGLGVVLDGHGQHLEAPAHLQMGAPVNPPRSTKFSTGAQIRAGRALLGWRRSDLGRAAGLHRNSIAYWERVARLPRSEPVGCRCIRDALFAAGVVAVNMPAPGVCVLPDSARSAPVSSAETVTAITPHPPDAARI